MQQNPVAIESTAELLAAGIDEIPGAVRHTLGNNLGFIMHAIDEVPLCSIGCRDCAKLAAGHIQDLSNGLKSISYFFGGDPEACLNIDLESSEVVELLCNALIGAPSARQKLLEHIFVSVGSSRISFTEASLMLKEPLARAVGLFGADRYGRDSASAPRARARALETAGYVGTLGQQLILLLYSGLLRDAMVSAAQAAYRNTAS